MSQRTTAAAVQGVLGRDYDTLNAPDLQPYIDTAWPVVDRVYTCSVRKGKTLTTQELLNVETWLSAHFYCQSDPTLQSKSTLSASGQFTGQTGMGLDSTRYGQSAMRADYSGCLTNIDKRQVASMDWVGKTQGEALTYDERN